MDDKDITVKRKFINAEFIGILKQHNPKEKRMVRESKTVNDLSTSVSSWTFQMMCNYINFRKHVTAWSEGNEKDSRFKKEKYKKLFKEYQRTILAHPHANPSDGISLCSESDVKSAVRVLVSKLADILGLKIIEEQTVDLDCFPTCRLDFLLTYDNIPIGGLEIKKKRTFNKKAFAQAIIQLVVLQQWSYKHGVHFKKDMTKVPIFNILSDGKRFVLLRIREGTIYVEKFTSKDKAFRSKDISYSIRHIIINEINDEQQFCNLFVKIAGVCSDAIREAKKLHDVLPYRKSKEGISLDAVANVTAWEKFLLPLVPGAKKSAKRQRPEKQKHDIPIAKNTIEGPKSLSRTFGTTLSKTFRVSLEEDMGSTHSSTQSTGRKSSVRGQEGKEVKNSNVKKRTHSDTGIEEREKDSVNYNKKRKSNTPR